MAIVITLAELQAWFESTKLEQRSVDATLEETARELVYSKVSGVYDTSSWVSVDTTPSLIRKVISLYVAAWIYKRAYSEDVRDTSETYGEELENMAKEVLAGIVDGSVDLPAETVPSNGTGQPIFWPNDTTGVLDPCSDVKFEMGTRF